jgi:hypothetical protein
MSVLSTRRSKPQYRALIPARYLCLSISHGKKLGLLRRLVNQVKLQPILRYHGGNRRETRASPMIRAGIWHEI